MESLPNRRVTLAARPSGRPTLTDFALVEEPARAPRPGDVVVEVQTLSIDAFIRTVLDDVAYHGSVSIGGTIRAIGVGRVLHSDDPTVPVGASVFGGFGSQTIYVGPAGSVRVLDVSEHPATAYLGALGRTTGVTAYVGMTYVGEVRPGETVVVSAAAGAVGTIAGQVARLQGASKVIGIAGGPAKCRFLVDELGYSAAIDYKNDDVAQQLAALAPEGIDVFFDNVGGDVLDAVLLNIREGSRVVICGGISNYDDMANVRGPKNYLKLAERHARMLGFAVSFYADRHAEAEQVLGGWLRSGELIMPETRLRGIERFPEALLVLLGGGHTGKLLLDVAE